MLSPFFLSVLYLSLISLYLLAHIHPWSSNAGEALKRLGETKAARVALSKYEQMTNRVRGRESERAREGDCMQHMPVCLCVYMCMSRSLSLTLSLLRLLSLPLSLSDGILNQCPMNFRQRPEFKV